MLRVDVDLTGELPRNPAGGPGMSVLLVLKWGLVAHYFGPPVPALADRAIIQGIAEQHIARDWDAEPYNGQRLRGDGIMYHLVIGRDGTLYQTRDVRDVLWHCGAWPHNRTALAVLVLVGGADRPTDRQRARLTDVADAWRAAGRCDRWSIWGHCELSPTSCPGEHLLSWVHGYRNGVRVMADGYFFPETGHYIGHGFWRFWQDNGGMPIFGYPLTDEIREVCEDGIERTVQYFERAVFEFYPENVPPYRVQLRRLGAAALGRRAVGPARDERPEMSHG